MKNKSYTKKTVLSVNINPKTKKILQLIASREYRDLSSQVNFILDSWAEDYLLENNLCHEGKGDKSILKKKDIT